MRQCVLAREQSVVGVQTYVRPSFHGFSEDMRPEPSSQRRWDRLLEEEPDVPTSSGSRPLQGGREFEPFAHRKEGRGVVLPIGFVEVDRQEETRFVQEQRVDARDERLALRILAR